MNTSDWTPDDFEAAVQRGEQCRIDLAAMTKRAEAAERESAQGPLCAFCQTRLEAEPKNTLPERVIDHMLTCPKHPASTLSARIEELAKNIVRVEAENEGLLRELAAERGKRREHVPGEYVCNTCAHGRIQTFPGTVDRRDQLATMTLWCECGNGGPVDPNDVCGEWQAL